MGQVESNFANLSCADSPLRRTWASSDRQAGKVKMEKNEKMKIHSCHPEPALGGRRISEILQPSLRMTLPNEHAL